MNHNHPVATAMPQKIIDTYYQKFYQQRKSSVFTSPISKFSSAIHPKSKDNFVFQINYETSKRDLSSNKSSKSKNLNKSISKSSVQNETQFLTNNNQFQSLQLNPNSPSETISLNIPKKNITFEANDKKKVKGSIKHIKSEARKKQFKAPNFDHFPEHQNLSKNSTKKNSFDDHFIKVNPYSKTVDFADSILNPQQQLKYFHSTVQVSPEKKDQLFTLENFSHIQVHKNKKNSYPSNTKEVYDIVRRKQVNPSPTHNFMESSFIMESQANKDKLKISENDDQRPVNRQKALTPCTLNHKEGLFKQFKPKIELKRRPSTGIPLRKNRNSFVQSALDQQKHQADLTTQTNNPKGKVDNFFNTLDSYNTRNFSQSRHVHSGKHSRGMTLNFNSPRGLKINSKQIHLLKYVDLSEADKIKDYFKKSSELGPKQLKNLVHLEFCRKSNTGKIQRYSGKSQKRKKDEAFFQPWESIDRDLETIQNDQLITNQIEHQIFNRNLND